MYFTEVVRVLATEIAKLGPTSKKRSRMDYDQFTDVVVDNDIRNEVGIIRRIDFIANLPGLISTNRPDRNSQGYAFFQAFRLDG